ncbi:MAG: ABC transporter ATP-binding protein [Acidimicrobiales bacterium]|nr:ABC transporter ATP-binding protein [Acidimicrobiales bacterium]
MSAPLLELAGVHAGYGPFKAVVDVDLTVPAGGAVALLGPNGAGKTTVARVVSGLVRPTAGTVAFDGEVISGLPAHEIARRGVAHAPEGRSVFATLSVEENLALPLRQAHGTARAAELTDQAYAMFPRLGERRAQLAGSLSGGEQRQLSLARVLVDPPRLLVVDELSLGLAPVIIGEVYQRLAEIRRLGTALLLVEQYVEHALGIAESIVVLRAGEVAYAGAPLPTDELSQLFLAAG